MLQPQREGFLISCHVEILPGAGKEEGLEDYAHIPRALIVKHDSG